MSTAAVQNIVVARAIAWTEQPSHTAPATAVTDSVRLWSCDRTYATYPRDTQAVSKAQYRPRARRGYLTAQHERHLLLKLVQVSVNAPTRTHAAGKVHELAIRRFQRYDRRPCIIYHDRGQTAQLDRALLRPLLQCGSTARCNAPPPPTVDENSAVEPSSSSGLAKPGGLLMDMARTDCEPVGPPLVPTLREPPPPDVRSACCPSSLPSMRSRRA